MLQAIVFSKDRACQLEFLLRTLYAKVVGALDVKVIYLSTNPATEKGYQKVQGKYPQVKFIKQGHFKQDVLTSLNRDISFSTFFVDDIAFIRPWNLQDGKIKSLITDATLACLSLRMDLRYNFSYPLSRKQAIPKMDNCCWEWQKADGDWGYPMSLDGHIFRTPEIVSLIESVEFANPNKLEEALAHKPLKRPRVICYPQAKIINNPINKVQTVNNNVNGQKYPVDVDFLNRSFLEGYIIDIRSLGDIDSFTACHQEFQISLIRE